MTMALGGERISIFGGSEIAGLKKMDGLNEAEARKNASWRN